VIDYDRLIILDQGKIAQMDTPYNLMRSEGIFRDMCKKSGAFEELEAAAKRASEDLTGPLR
jgi:ABC-type transport system involved in cytochrome bd biosynthesis fused ATPase/permease subunit